jgi:hypothetical protein
MSAQGWVSRDRRIQATTMQIVERKEGPWDLRRIVGDDVRSLGNLSHPTAPAHALGSRKSETRYLVSYVPKS